MINAFPLCLLLTVLWPGSSTIDTPLHCFETEAEPSDYLVLSSGKIYRQSAAGKSVPEPELMADLSDSGWQFSPLHKMVQSWLPVTAFGYQQQFEQLMLLARDPVSQGDQLVIVRLFPQQHDAVWQFADLAPHLDDDVLAGAESSGQSVTVESLWHQVQAAPGWWRPLSGWATQLPQLYAGMLYLPTVTDMSPTECPSYPLDLTVKIIHMHSGHTTRPDEVIALQQAGPLQWQLRPTSEQQLSLWLVQDEAEWQLAPALQQITTECLDCYQTLELTEWPQQLELATFWHEEGAY
ncbi:MAG: hypothetical protein LAT66_05225 [Alkalimonas sp.]|nr:hypothetical protein [Alkalimonas sp.]